MYTFGQTSEISDSETKGLKNEIFKYQGTLLDRQMSFQTNKQKITDKQYQSINNLPTNGSPSKPSLQRQFATWL